MHFAGVIQCQSEDVTPNKEFQNQWSDNQGRYVKKLVDFFSTNDDLHHNNSKQSERYPENQTSQFLYPSAFSLASEQPQSQWTPSSINYPTQNSNKQFQCHLLDRLFDQIGELRMNVDKLEKVAQKFHKIYHDSQIVLQTDLHKGRIIQLDESTQNIAQNNKEEEDSEEYLQSIRKKLQEILNTAIIQQQQMKNYRPQSEQPKKHRILRELYFNTNSNPQQKKRNINCTMSRSVEPQFCTPN